MSLGHRVVAVIPARYASSRFPGKPLALIAGKPMIERVYQRVAMAKGLSDVLVATDDRRIAACVAGFGGKAVMTHPALPSGTDRMAAALKRLSYDWALNVQGDEPFIDPLLISSLIDRAKRCAEPSIVTAAVPISAPRAINNINIVKAVMNEKGRALYFSRSPIPCLKRADSASRPPCYRHLGIYLFHRDALRRFVSRKPSALERIEKLEQLRAFELGIPIEVVLTRHEPVNVDIPADIRRAEKALRAAGGR